MVLQFPNTRSGVYILGAFKMWLSELFFENLKEQICSSGWIILICIYVNPSFTLLRDERVHIAFPFVGQDDTIWGLSINDGMTGFIFVVDVLEIVVKYYSSRLCFF